DLEAADADAVLPAADGVADLVVAEDAVAAEVLDDELALDRPLSPDVDLFFTKHAGPPFPQANGCSPYDTNWGQEKRRRLPRHETGCAGCLCAVRSLCTMPRGVATLRPLFDACRRCA